MVVVEVVIYFKNKIVNIIKNNVPLLNKLIWGPDEVCLFPRTIFLYFYGIFLGYMLWKYFLLQIPFIAKHVTIFAIIIMTFFGSLSVISKAFRCITSLTLISLCGKSGRSLLRAIIIAFLISGPLNNILINAREVVKVFTCSSILTYNLTKTRIDLMSLPFMNAMKDLKDDIPKISNEFEKIDNIIDPITNEIELEEDQSKIMREEREIQLKSPMTYNQQYKEKLEKRCRQQMQSGVERCKKSFQDAYLRCKAAMPVVINYILCLPMSFDVFCHFTRIIENVCTPDIDNEIGENYLNMKNIQNQLKGNVSNISIDYKALEIHNATPLM